MARLTRTALRMLALLLAFTFLPASQVLAQTQNKDQKLNFPYYDDAAAAVACGTNLAGSDNAEKAFHFFVSKGYQPYQAAGILGNMMYESGIQPQRLQGTAAGVSTPASVARNSSLGWGIVQWTPAGKMIDPVVAEGKDPNDLGVQLEFLWNQLEGNPPLPEKQAGDEIKATPNVDEAVKAFQGTSGAGGQYFGFERPADQSSSIPERTTFAKDFLAQFGSSTASPTSGGCAGLDASGCPTAPISVGETVTAAGIQVHPCMAAEVERVVNLANEQGLDMGGGGYRDREAQIQARREHCGTSNYDIYEKPASECNPSTAPPGDSRHERGTAVDFTCGGQIIPTRSHPCYTFLDNNTSLINLPSEAWHWSVDGS